MRHACIAIAIIASSAVAACHPDACVWSVARTRSDATATLARNAQVVDVAAIAAGAFSGRSLRTDERASYVSMLLTVDNDAAIDSLVLEVDLGEPDPTAVVALDATNTELRLILDSVIVAEGAASGTLSLHPLDVPCEFSDAYLDDGASWTCATNLDATIDAAFATGTDTYQIGAMIAQREALSERCYPCNGIEGCDY